MVDLAVATRATNAAVHVRGVIVENVIGQSMDPNPVDRQPIFPTLADRLELWIIFLNLAVAVHAHLGVRHVRMGGDFHEAVTITAIHPELGDMNIMRKRHRLDWLIADLRVFRRDVIPRGRGESANNQNTGDGHLQRQPVAPAWKKIRHKSADALVAPIQPTT